jgi:hypothetical protein
VQLKRTERQSFYNVSQASPLVVVTVRHLTKAIVVHAPKVETALLGAYEYIALRYRLWQFNQWRLSIFKNKYYLVITYNYPVTMGPIPSRKTRVFYFDMTNYYRKKSP